MRLKIRKNKCDYYKCKGIATKQIETRLKDLKPYILNVCENCYNEYLEMMNINLEE